MATAIGLVYRAGEGQFEYVNPAHVIRARDTDDDGPQVAVLDMSY